MKFLLVSTLLISAAPEARAQQDSSPEKKVAQSETNAAQTTQSDTDTQVETITVTGQRETAAKAQVSTDPTSAIATTFSLNQKDFNSVVTATTVDLIRTIPGVNGGYVNGGIANGLGLRGWSGTGDGTSIAAYIDNAPVNYLSGGNSNGYLELHPLIPETVETLDLVKGPFSVRYGGPFSFGGSLIINTADYIPTGFKQSIGSFGRTRSLANYGYNSGDVKFYSILEGFHEDGYRQNAYTKRVNSFTKLTVPIGSGTLRSSFQFFQNNFGQPMYPPLSAVQAGPKTLAVNRLDKGNRTAFFGRTNYSVDLGGFQINANAYFDKSYIHRASSRWSTNVPIINNRDLQQQTRDNRWVYGGGLDVFRPIELGGDATLGLRAGGTIQQNDVKQTRYPAFYNIPVSQPSYWDAATQQQYYNSSFTELATAAYFEAQLKPVNWLKLSAGVRYDQFDYDVDVVSVAGAVMPTFNKAGVQLTSGNSGKLQYSSYTNYSGRYTGRGGVAVFPIDYLTVYANYGQGVQPNHAVTDLRTNNDLNTVGMDSREAGITYDNPRTGLRLNFDAYKTLNSGEIQSVGGIATNVGKSRRRGFDVDGAVYVYRNNGYKLKLTSSYSGVNARVTNTPATPYLLGVPAWQYSYGLDFEAPVKILGYADELIRWTVFYSKIGPTKNNAAGTVEAPQYDRLTSRVSYSAPSWRNLEVYLGGIFYPSSVTSECCAYTTYDGTRAVAIVPRVSVEGGVSVGF